MSRDWTPRQLHMVDIRAHLSKNVITINYGEGERPYIDPNCETAKKYPNMYFLCGEILKVLLEKKSEAFVERVEDGLTTIMALFDSDLLRDGRALSEPVDNAILQQLRDIELLRLICMWYDGKLDEGFYYNTYNNELFLDGLMEMKEV